MQDVIQIAHEVINTEIHGITQVRDSLGKEFTAMVEKCIATLDAGGKLVLTGIGKSGYIGKKMAATLASTGSPSIFMHPVEALHGDLGMLQKHDLLIALSYSGETDELLTTMKPAKRLGVEIVSITGNANSTLGKLSELVVPMTVEREACPFNLAPTTTTTALLALGDALAIVLLKVRGFTKSDYGRLHPGGAIGRAVTMRAMDIMRSKERFASATVDVPVREVLCRMGQARCGATVIVDDGNKVLGIFTDGDFRRAAERDITVLSKPIGDFMTPNPVTVRDEELAVSVLKLVEERKVNSVIVADSQGRAVGLIDVQDLPGLKLM
ncbi:MAG: KpsF/GutQ family sugar-phosphate isomerase [Victivallaceae bacterium]|nr:KpsF/GutQ family sugar-phosphate isomerase [Victivallaceae bacterium]